MLSQPILTGGGLMALAGAAIAAFVRLSTRVVTRPAAPRASAPPRRRPVRQRLVILGSAPLALDIVQEIGKSGSRRWQVVGLVTDAPHESLDVPCPLLGRVDQLAEILEVAAPHRVVVALRERRGRFPVRQLLDARLKNIVIVPAEEFYERLTGKVAIESFTPGRFLFSNDFGWSRIRPTHGRVMSLIFAFSALVLLFPLLALIALAIKLDSPGPVFFVQERVGLRGRRFQLIKFRTMRPVDSETSVWVRDNGHRITRVGRWLRKFRLDELPQLVNLLRGEMNLVGPRPHPACNLMLITTVARNASDRGIEIPYYSLRTLIPPGMTGWAQVRYGYANGIEEEVEKLKYDLFYVKHLSLKLDLRILFETVKVVLLGQRSESAGSDPGHTSTDDEAGSPRAA
jgi:exopolysaccharide biosynthesis polyprenyl glycosylphosphotransferase